MVQGKKKMKYLKKRNIIEVMFVGERSVEKKSLKKIKIMFNCLRNFIFNEKVEKSQRHWASLILERI